MPYFITLWAAKCSRSSVWKVVRDSQNERRQFLHLNCKMSFPISFHPFRRNAIHASLRDSPSFADRFLASALVSKISHCIDIDQNNKQYYSCVRICQQQAPGTQPMPLILAEHEWAHTHSPLSIKLRSPSFPSFCPKPMNNQYMPSLYCQSCPSILQQQLNHPSSPPPSRQFTAPFKIQMMLWQNSHAIDA